MMIINDDKVQNQLLKLKHIDVWPDILAFSTLSGVLAYNTYVIHRFRSFSKYPFELTHIVAGFIWLLVAGSLIASIHENRTGHDYRGKNFSNAVGFAFALSLLVDTMYWVTIYPSSTIHGRADLASVILMHAIITIIFSIWMLAKKQTPHPFANNQYRSFEYPLFFNFILPVVIITLLYMGWTNIGQNWLVHEAIYPNVIDWKNQIKTFTTFGMAFGLLSLFVILYNAPILFKGLRCCSGNDALDDIQHSK